MFDHTPGCVCIFIWKLVINDPSNYNRCEEFVSRIALACSIFFLLEKMLCFYLSPVCVTELKIAIATQPAKYLITLQGDFVEKKVEYRKIV